MDDQQLMLRVKAGDGEAFDELVVRHRDRVVNFLYRMVGNADEAEDLAQEAFFRAYKARARYEPVAQFTTWLFRIACNLAISHYRKRGRRRMEMLPDLPSAQATPDATVISNETTRRVWEAMGQLTGNQRTALVLTRFEEHSYEQAAEIMNTTVAAIRSLVSRARDQLRGRLRNALGAAVTRGG